MCSTGMLRRARARGRRACRRPTASVPSGSVEMTISEMWKYWTAFMIAVYGSGSPIMPAATMPASSQRVQQAAQPLARLARPRGPARRSCGTTTMKRCGPSSASAFRRSTQLRRRRPSGSRPRASRRTAGPRRRGPTTTCSTGSAGRLLAGARSGRACSQPDDVGRQGGDDDLVDRAARATASIAGVERVGVADLAVPSMPLSRMNSSARSTRTCAESRTTSS